MGLGAAKFPEEWVVPSERKPSVIVTSEGLTGSGVFSTVPRASVVHASLSAVGPDGSAIVAGSADVCRGLSSTTSSVSAAVGVPSEVDMTGTSRESLAGEPASADGSLINAGGGWRCSLARSAGGLSYNAIVEGWISRGRRQDEAKLRDASAYG